MATIVEMREISTVKLEDMLEDAREEMFNLRFQLASARLEDVSRIRTVRRNIARLESVLNMRRLAVKSALAQTDVADALAGKDWLAEAFFSYEDSAWKVDFTDEDENELASAMVDLNRKQRKGRRGRAK